MERLLQGGTNETLFFTPLSLLSEDSKHDLGVIWQAFKAARMREERDIAYEKLCAYLHEGILQEPEGAAALPQVSGERDRFGVVPTSIA